MENHVPVSPASLPTVASNAEIRADRWDCSAFRLHALAMNHDLAVMSSVSALETFPADRPVHWVLLDPVLASIVRSSVSHQKEIARLTGSAPECEGQLVPDMLVRLGLAGVTEPRTALACALFAARLLCRSSALTVAQHRDMLKAAQARRQGWSHG